MLAKMASGTHKTGGWMGPRSSKNVAKGRIPLKLLTLPYISPGLTLHATHVPGHFRDICHYLFKRAHYNLNLQNYCLLNHMFCVFRSIKCDKTVLNSTTSILIFILKPLHYECCFQTLSLFLLAFRIYVFKLFIATCYNLILMQI
jgi:hypothetical protein